MAVMTTTTPFLAPVERPKGLFLRLGYYFTRKKFGKVMTPLSVFSARMPTAFTIFYGKIGKLDKKVEISHELVQLIREHVSTVNGCGFCMDANRAGAANAADSHRAKMDAIESYETDAAFSEAERAALDYASEVTRNKAVASETFASLARHFNEREICDIVWVISSEHLYNINNIALNIGSDGLCEIAAHGKER